MPKKVLLYTEQRQNVINKLLEILEITETNNIFSLHKIDNDAEKQQLILDLEPDVKKYFNCSTWSCFKQKNTITRRWLSFTKYLFKEMNISMNACRTNNNNTEGTIYLITKT